MLVSIGQEHGVSAAQVALAYLLERPAVTSLVIGARTAEQLADNLAAAELVLTEEERERLDTVSDLPLIYRYWPGATTCTSQRRPGQSRSLPSVVTRRQPRTSASARQAAS